MPSIRSRVDPIDRDVKLFIDELLSPQAQARQFAADAKVFLDEADDTNRRILGRIPPSKTWVDGSEGRSLESVKPGGVIVREYELVIDLLSSIADALRAVSPVRSGRYQASHTLFADGNEVAIGGVIPPAEEYVFVSTEPYARKIEGLEGRKPLSSQAPKGVYQFTAAKFRRDDRAKVRFEEYRGVVGVMLSHGPYETSQKTKLKGNKARNRFPAIIVTMGR